MLKLQGRYYRTIPIDKSCYKTEVLELDPKKTALIGMHCWNIGCEDGPEVDLNYFVGIGFPEATKEAGRIMKECIRPAMDAARKAGVLVCHVESALIADKHPEAKIDEDKDTGYVDPVPHEATGGHRKEMADRFHGVDHMTKSPLAKMDRAKIVMPKDGEPFVYQTGQLDRVLQKHGIENLIYTGFCTDMCILRAPGGVEPIVPLGYRTLLMRDATLGGECPDTFDERIATRWAVRFFETHFGDTITFDDFIKACEKI